MVVGGNNIDNLRHSVIRTNRGCEQYSIALTRKATIADCYMCHNIWIFIQPLFVALASLYVLQLVCESSLFSRRVDRNT